MRIPNWFKLLCASLVFQVPPLSAAAATYTVFDTGDNSEKLAEFPNDKERRVLFSQDIGAVSVGDILIVDYESEVTNTSPYLIFLSSNVVLSNSETSTQGIALEQFNGFNTTPEQYHSVLVKHAIFKITQATNNHFVNVWVAGGSEHLGQHLDVVPDHGKLQVLLIHSGN